MVLLEEARLAKNKAISASYEATRVKRAGQVAKTFELKITTNKLSKRQSEALTRLFLEAKWVYNHILSLDSITDFDDKLTAVPVKIPDGSLDLRDLKVIGSQQKQSVFTGVKRSVKGLAALKKNGHKVGKLKFKHEYNSIELKQAGTTYKIKGNSIKVQNITGWLTVRGAHQLKDWDLASAKIVKRPSGYYLLVTAYKEPEPDDFAQGTIVGIDWGLASQLTLTSGEKVSIAIGESDRLRRLRRKLNRQVKGSNGSKRTRRLIRLECERQARYKDEVANQLSSQILKHEVIVIQDDDFSSWSKSTASGGSVISAGVLGRVKSILSRSARCIVIPRFEKTTQTCVCGNLNKLELNERVYSCACGYTADRDTHSSEMMIRFALKYTGGEPARALVESVLDEGLFSQRALKLETSKFKDSRLKVVRSAQSEASGSSAQM